MDEYNKMRREGAEFMMQDSQNLLTGVLCDPVDATHNCSKDDYIGDLPFTEKHGDMGAFDRIFRKSTSSRFTNVVRIARWPSRLFRCTCVVCQTRNAKRI